MSDLPPDDVMREILGMHADNPQVKDWVREFRLWMIERETWYPEKDAGFWERLGVHGDLPAHLPMGVNKQGQGPVEPDPAHHYVCWCSDIDCPLTMALQHAWLAGRTVADE
jgi:hypothetical protein